MVDTGELDSWTAHVQKGVEPVVQTWNAYYSFHWNPLVSFAQRRAELANWIDVNLAPIGILDQDEYLGLAVSHRSLRTTLSRSGFDVSLGAPGLKVESVAGLIRGIGQLIRPSGVHLASASVVNTVAVDGDYNTLRSEFGARCAGLLPDGFRIYDGSALVDASSDDGYFYLEFGIVTAAELKERLEKPALGRLSGRRQRVPADLNDRKHPLPAVSVFCEVNWRALQVNADAEEDTDSLYRYVEESTEKANNFATQLAQAIANNATKGESHEYSRGA